MQNSSVPESTNQLDQQVDNALLVSSDMPRSHENEDSTVESSVQLSNRYSRTFPRRTTRVRKAPNRYGEWISYYFYDRNCWIDVAFVSSLCLVVLHLLYCIPDHPLMFRRNMAEILRIRRKTQSNQSIPKYLLLVVIPLLSLLPLPILTCLSFHFSALFLPYQLVLQVDRFVLYPDA